jgi:hypothetical protein
MISYYPNRVRTFPTHRNLLDDVDAAHINSIQAELHAVMTALGTNPQIYNDIQTDNVVTEAIPNDEGEVIDDDTIFTSTNRYYDPKVKPVDHGSLGQRLDDIERGKQHHVFRLAANNLNIASKTTSLSSRPGAVRFPKPSASNDPFNLYNGVGVRLRKSGFWIFHASVLFALQGPTAGSNDGLYQAVIDHNGNFIEGLVREKESGTAKNPTMNPVLMGFFNAGTNISLRVSHNSGRTQKIRNARLAGVLIRESV